MAKQYYPHNQYVTDSSMVSKPHFMATLPYTNGCISIFVDPDAYYGYKYNVIINPSLLHPREWWRYCNSNYCFQTYREARTFARKLVKQLEK